MSTEDADGGEVEQGEIQTYTPAVILKEVEVDSGEKDEAEFHKE
jgi:hypothetical protein